LSKVINNINIESNIVFEKELPYPYAYYPPAGGTFFSFAKSENDDPVFCLCSKDAIQNYIKLKQIEPFYRNSDPLVERPLPKGTFHEFWAKKFTQETFSIEKLDYEYKLCHRCNLKTPYLNYCHPMYSGNFRQKYGWYINQNFYKIGFSHSRNYLISIPDEIKEIADRISAINQKKTDYLNPEIYASSDEIFLKGIAFEREASKLSRELRNIVENITRKDFGFAKIGDGWISETILFNLVQQIFPNENILRHFRPEWLNKLELDIYLPDRSLAFEYQGLQHFKPMKIFGGQIAFNKLIERDRIKKELCKGYNIRLIEIKYTEPLIIEYIQSKIKLMNEN